MPRCKTTPGEERMLEGFLWIKPAIISWPVLDYQNVYSLVSSVTDDYCRNLLPQLHPPCILSYPPHFADAADLNRTLKHGMAAQYMLKTVSGHYHQLHSDTRSWLVNCCWVLDCISLLLITCQFQDGDKCFILTLEIEAQCFILLRHGYHGWPQVYRSQPRCFLYYKTHKKNKKQN